MSRRRHISTSGVAASGPGTPRGFGDRAANLSERYAATPITLSVKEFIDRSYDSVSGVFARCARTRIVVKLPVAIHYWGHSEKLETRIASSILAAGRPNLHTT